MSADRAATDERSADSPSGGTRPWTSWNWSRLPSLRRQGFTPAVLRQMMDTLRDYFRRRLSETLDDAGDLRLLTDGSGLFLRTQQGHIFDLLADPMQPLITGDGLPLKPVAVRATEPRAQGARASGAKR